MDRTCGYLSLVCYIAQIIPQEQSATVIQFPYPGIYYCKENIITLLSCYMLTTAWSKLSMGCHDNPIQIKVKMVFTIHIYLEFILSFRLFNGQQGIIIQNFSTRSILTVTNVTQEHFGNYTCVAVNKLGTTNASLPLSRK